ncbi:NADPH-dependent oxidoreductase [Sneathiella chungangensis]|uniref:NADPH-dependent oxidoreductase n=1 Tax=Sneathiella chungangensis TaxID=1418234 RepID=A0A845M702_9PROT|nr:NAD(P)H-dependent oxidoreductase [Sneathiella chungangensis]MZR20893.1 NADPH-dependent oxidoreductase [Sneathiella chungangensis]
MSKTTIGIVVGSIRKKSQSDRIGKYINDLLGEFDPSIEVELFQLRDLEIPLWHEDKWESGSDLQTFWKPISDRLKSCAGFVVISPEWAGMAPPHLKNFLLMCDGGELAHKPALLVTVSSGMGGAYPVAELRMSGYKNNFLWWMPDHMILRQVEGLFVSNPPTDLDNRLRARLLYVLEFLVETAKAMAPVRASVQNLKLYKNGM